MVLTYLWELQLWATLIIITERGVTQLLFKELLITTIYFVMCTITVLSQEIPVFLVGDSAYPLSTWLMKPFPHNIALSTAQRNFNYRLSRARIVSENVFGRLKARWRRLQKLNDMAINNIPNVIIACCILHNVSQVHGDVFNDLWLDDSQLDQPVQQPRHHLQLKIYALH